MNDKEFINQFDRIHTRLDQLPCMNHEGRLSSIERGEVNGKEYAKRRYSGKNILIGICMIVMTALVAAATLASLFK